MIGEHEVADRWQAHAIALRKVDSFRVNLRYQLGVRSKKANHDFHPFKWPDADRRRVEVSGLVRGATFWSMLFNFTLAPLNEIKPWGEPGQESLHWFGLTDSQYWIDVGAARLLEYSEAAQRCGAHRFCDYHVVRLYEDVIDLARYALEPIPPDLVPYIAGQGRKRTLDRMSAWCDKNSERTDDHYWSVVGAASTWIGTRKLDTAYLQPSADIVMWSDESSVHIEWDNRDKLIDGAIAWTALFGKYSLTRADFVAECRWFHERLMDAMSERVNQVAAGALSPAIHIDLDGLAHEHEQRRHLSPLNFGALPSPTDWAAVRQAMSLIGA